MSRTARTSLRLWSQTFTFHQAIRRRQPQFLLRSGSLSVRKPPPYVFAGGDWNLTEHASDSSSADHFSSTPTMRSVLSKTLNHFNLHEIYQPLHTRCQGESSARLDRFYISHSVGDKCCITRGDASTSLTYARSRR